MNIRDARNALGDLVKGAPKEHYLSRFEVGQIKQGKDGWGAARVWPVFEAIRPLAGVDSKEAAVAMVRSLLDDDAAAVDVLNAFSAVDWRKLLCDAETSEQAPQGQTVEVKPVAQPDVSQPVKKAPTAPSGSSSAMRAVLHSLTKQVEEQEEQEALTANLTHAVSELHKDIKGLAVHFGAEVGTMQKAISEAAKTGGSGSVAPAAIKAAVATALGELAPDEAKVKKAAKAARELPAVPDQDRSYVKPRWHDDVATFIKIGKHGVIGGSSGAGKTFPLKQVAAELGLPCKVISANEGLTADTLISEPGIKGGTSFYSDGPLLHAMRHGYMLVFDEGDELRRGEALVLNDAIENRRVTNPYTGEVVVAAPGFVVWFTSNSLGDELGIYNREGFDESLRQRLMEVVAAPLTLAQEVRILTKVKSPSGRTISKDDATLLAKWAHAARPLHFGINGHEAILEGLPSTRILVEAAEVWLGFNSKTGLECSPLSDREQDVRKALWYPYAGGRTSEEITALKAVNLWIW